jgi:hypothetical protein
MATVTLQPYDLNSTSQNASFLRQTNASGANISQITSIGGTRTPTDGTRNSAVDLVFEFGRIDTTENSTGAIVASGAIDTTVNVTLDLRVGTANRNNNPSTGGNNLNLTIQYYDAKPVGPGQNLNGTVTSGSLTGINNIQAFTGNNIIQYSFSWTAAGTLNSNISDFAIGLTHNVNATTGGGNQRRFLIVDYAAITFDVIDAVPPGKSQAIWV